MKAMSAEQAHRLRLAAVVGFAFAIIVAAMSVGLAAFYPTKTDLMAAGVIVACSIVIVSFSAWFWRRANN
jgi:hypothetical protein